MDREFALGFSETIIIRAMLDTRRTLVLLHRVGNLPSFPDTLKAHVSNEIEQYAKRSQHSLEESAKQDRTGQLSRMVKHNSLLNYRQQAAQEQEIIVQSTVQSAQARPILSNLPKQNQDHERNDRHAMLGILGVIGVLIIGAVIYSYR
jgi:mannosyltransferase OCH1-like enzyme